MMDDMPSFDVPSPSRSSSDKAAAKNTATSKGLMEGIGSSDVGDENKDPNKGDSTAKKRKAGSLKSGASTGHEVLELDSDGEEVQRDDDDAAGGTSAPDPKKAKKSPKTKKSSNGNNDQGEFLAGLALRMLGSSRRAEDKIAEAMLLEAKARMIEAEVKSAESKQKSAESKIDKIEDALDKACKRLEMCRNTQNEGMKKFWEKRIEQLHNMLQELENEEIRLFFPDW